MKDKGQITVFLCLVLGSLLVLFLAAVEIVGFYRNKACVSQAAKGASEHIKADYQAALFENYHLLLLDKDYKGLGEGGIEDALMQYLEYTLSPQGFTIHDAGLTNTNPVLENHCEELKKQINEYMTLYLEAEVVKEAGGMLLANNDAAESMHDNIQEGKNEVSDSESKWKGEDPRKLLNDEIKTGLLNIVLPVGTSVSGKKIDMADAPSLKYGKQADTDADLVDTTFSDIDRLEAELGNISRTDASALQQNGNGILYALSCFDYFTREDGLDNPLKCEVEYLICGKDNDYDNLSAVVNWIMLHRLPVNMAALLLDKTKMAEIESMALVLALTPGVTYGAAKYLLVACLAYGETLIEVKFLLAGNQIPLVKNSSNWILDFDSIGKLSDIETVDYKGADGIDYEAFLMLLLAEKSNQMYYRMCDIMQLNVRQEQDDFRIENCISAFTADLNISRDSRDFSLSIGVSY